MRIAMTRKYMNRPSVERLAGGAGFLRPVEDRDLLDAGRKRLDEVRDRERAEQADIDHAESLLG